jgi:carbamoyl-phosphate synthase large subunit
LSKFAQELKTCVVASSAHTAQIYLDKYASYKYLSRNKIPFAKSWLAGEYDCSEQEIIAKPREGRGSRGLIINPENPNNLPTDYIIQPLYKGKEITTAIYVNKVGQLHGLFTMERILTNGTTTEAKVIFQYDAELKVIAEKMIALGGLVGSFNIQSIVSSEGQIMPFEINCRISGTNSIRHNLGFQDVKYAIQEYLLNESPDEPKPIQGIATRILMDVIYPNTSSFENINAHITPHLLY